MNRAKEVSGTQIWEAVDDPDVLQRYRDVARLSDCGLYQLDVAGRFVAVNDSLLEQSGYASEALLGEHISVLLDDNDVDRIEHATHESLDAEMTTSGSFDVTIKTADEEHLPVELRINPLVEDGDLQGSIGAVHDRGTADRESEQLTSGEGAYDSITTVLDEANIGVFVLDAEFDVAWIDETIETIFGLDRESVIGQDKRQLIEESVKHQVADPDHFAETVLATYDDNSYIERFECRLSADENRDERWLEHYSKPIESGEFEGGRIELYYDITGRKQSEDTLKETEQRFRSLVDAVEEYAIFRLDEDGYVTSWNAGAEAIKGYEREEILGKHFSTFYTGEDRAEGIPERNLEAAIEAGSVEDEGWRLRKDGSRFWANVTITAVRGDDGTHEGFLKVTRDMTDRHRREQELESELQRIFGRITDGFYALDEDCQFTHVNERAEQILGVDGEELLGTSLWTSFPELRDTAFDEYYHEAMRTQESISFEAYYPPIDAWYEVHAYPSETGLSVYFRDVTERREREQELRRTERRFEATFEDPNILVGLLEPDGTVVDINQTAMEYVDAGLADVTGKPFWETPWWGEGDDLQRDIKKWTERAADGEYVDFEADLTRPDGDQYTLSGYFRPVTNDEDEVVSIIVSDRDITERKRRERELERSERRYRTLVEYFPDGIVTLFDHNLKYRLAAGQGFDRLSVDSDTVEGRHFRDVWGDSAVDELTPVFQAALSGEERSIELEYEGREWVLHAVPITDERGDVFAGMTVARDITQRKERERRLERRAAQQQVVADLGQMALKNDDIDELMHEATSQVADVLDTEYCKVLDLSDDRDELLLRQGVGWREGIAGEATVSAVETNSQAAYTLENDHPVVVEDLEMETRFSGPDLLTSHDVRSGISTVIGPFDDPWGILGAHDTATQTFTDEDVNFVQSVANVLAEAIYRHNNEQELERLIDRLEESNERLEQFAYAASHDLQEPLRMVSSYLQLLEQRYDDELDQDGQEFLEFAVDGAERMSEMIEGLLTYSRVETRGDPFEPVNLETILDEVRDDLKVSIEESDAEITADELPTVHGDVSQLRQVFLNLLDNAIEYSGDDPPQISITADRDGLQWVISVRDEGIGIDPDNTDQVFEVFQRLHTREEHAGTGIGLALCERIIERHGGDIWVESKPGEGTTFSFTLPAARGNETGGQ